MLFTFEGIDGSGKTTAVKNVHEKLAGESFDVEKTFEPGDGGLCIKLRELILDNKDSFNSFETTALFLCERSHHVRTKIRPWLSAGKNVLCDRFIASTMVYQGYLNGMSEIQLNQLFELNMKAIHPVRISKTFFFEVEPETALNRILQREKKDSYDSVSLEHYEKLLKCYRSFFKDFIEAVYINAEKTEDEITEEVSFYIRKAIER